MNISTCFDLIETMMVLGVVFESDVLETQISSKKDSKQSRVG